MKIMPMGDYYVWHCDWCDSTNYTIWARMEQGGLACAACHQHFSGFAGSYTAFNRPGITEKGLNTIGL